MPPIDEQDRSPNRRANDARIIEEIEAMARQTARLVAILDGRPDEGVKGLRAEIVELRSELREVRNLHQQENGLLRKEIAEERKARETVQNKLDGVVLAVRFAATIVGAGGLVAAGNFLAGLFSQ